MIARLFLLTMLAFATAVLLAFSLKTKKVSYATSTIERKVLKCGPDWEQLEKYFEETSIPPIAGAGSYTWKIATNNDSAQFYFNQGINMYYSFHIIEAIASFKKAARFDPSCAMLYWAEALTYGPNINDIGYAASPEALEANSKSVALVNGSTSLRDKMLIDAMQARYSADSTQSRANLNQLYVDKMKEAYAKFPADPDVATLYADAMMLQHPWDLWNVDGTPKAWTPLIREVLEKVLAKTPNQPGANHYYIHVMEPSPYAAKALPSANRLGKLTPGLSHTVHMPSHIYLRTGHYDKGVTVNENAVNSYKKIIPIYSPVTGADFLYIIHNLHMQTDNALLAGRSAYSISSAIETVNSIPKDYLGIPGSMGSYVQYVYMTPMFVDVRFGRWEQILSRTQPDASLVYANILYRFGRGMALAGKMNIPAAKLELEQLQALMKDTTLLEPLGPFSPAIEGAKVAESLLTGSILLLEKKHNEAIAAFQKAVSTDENMIYNEPRDWLLNPRHWLGNALLVVGKPAEAEKIFKKDLTVNNENVWALTGLQQALQKQGKDASTVQTRLGKASSQVDTKIKAAVF